MPEGIEGGISPKEEGGEAKGFMTRALGVANEIIDLHLAKYTPDQWEKDLYKKPESAGDFFGLHPEVTLNIVERLAGDIGEGLSGKDWENLVTWLADGEVDERVLEAVQKFCAHSAFIRGNNVGQQPGYNQDTSLDDRVRAQEEALEELRVLREQAKYSSRDEEGEEVFNGDLYTREQILFVLESLAANAGSVKEREKAVLKIAEQCITHGSQGTYIRTGPNRKLLNLAFKRFKR